MAKRWTYRGMIDGDIGLTPHERREAERRMSEIGKRKRPMRGALLLVLTFNIIVCASAARPLIRFIQQTLDVDRTVALLIAVVPMILFSSVLVSIVFWHMLRKPMREALGELGHEVCINCGHLLRGLQDASPNCPECGRPRASKAANPRDSRNEVAP